MASHSSEYDEVLDTLAVFFEPWREWFRLRRQFTRRLQWNQEKRSLRIQKWSFNAWRQRYILFVAHFAALTKAARVYSKHCVLTCIRDWRNGCIVRRRECERKIGRHHQNYNYLPLRPRAAVHATIRAWYRVVWPTDRVVRLRQSERDELRAMRLVRICIDRIHRKLVRAAFARWQATRKSAIVARQKRKELKAKVAKRKVKKKKMKGPQNIMMFFEPPE